MLAFFIVMEILLTVTIAYLILHEDGMIAIERRFFRRVKGWWGR